MKSLRVRPAFNVMLLAVVLTVGWLDSSSQAQSSSESGPGAAIAPGGAAMADFDTLMNLIQQTIDPESWLAAGGTSTMLPYPSGVYVDPQGHMKRVEVDVALSKADLQSKGSSTHLWQQPSPLRTVSLKQLDRAIYEHAVSGRPLNPELMQLAGLESIRYVQLDFENEDVLIAGAVSKQTFGINLHDLCVVAALVKANTDPFGCSIEPSNDGIRAAQQIFTRRDALTQLSRRPQTVVDEMQQKIGAHNVHVFGMNGLTGTAVALIDADEHMKRVGFGEAKMKPLVKSYFDFLDVQKSVPTQSLIRWWFAYSDLPIKVSSDGRTFELPAEAVAVLSEQQWVTQNGRQPTGNVDPAADGFAAEFTKAIPELRKNDESYARLGAVFEVALALQLVQEATGQPDLKAWLPNLCGLGTVTSPEANRPQTVEGLTTWHKLRSGTVVAVVSGGVKVDPRGPAAKSKWEQSKFLASSIVPKQTTIANESHSQWWWD